MKFREHSHCGIGVVATRDNQATHTMLSNGLTLMKNLEHRAGFSGDGTSDGAGMMLDIPVSFFNKIVKKDYHSVLMLMVKKDEILAEKVIGTLSKYIPIVFKRYVPTNSKVLTPYALAEEPYFIQLFIDQTTIDVNFIEQKLLKSYTKDEAYIMSWSKSTIIYKGLLSADDFSDYFIDFQDDEFKTRFSLIHQRFSTNTLPKWRLAQPFRLIAHNGEINTIKGNINWMSSRFIEKNQMNYLSMNQSDSANLDAVMNDFMVKGISLEESLMTLIPKAFESIQDMSANERAFYHYKQLEQEPWDGPAAVLSSDGRSIVSTLDRNGLRPIRYSVTDELFVLSSEMGVLDESFDSIQMSGRLNASEVIKLDLETGEVITDEQIKNEVCSTQDYQKLLEETLVKVPQCEVVENTSEVNEAAYGYTDEVNQMIIKEMAVNGKEPIYSLSYDAPLAVLNENQTLIFDYFKQQFAEVTNPPIDAIREELVFSLTSYIKSNKTYEFKSPFFDHQDFLNVINHSEISNVVYTLGFNNHIKDALSSLVENVLKTEADVIVLDDEVMGKTIPSLLAVSAVHHALIDSGKRLKKTIVVKAADCKETHHIATLIGYGADFIYPYHALTKSWELNGLLGRKNYKVALEKGLYKIMSKMGISTLASYRGAKIFDAVGLSSEVIDAYLEGTNSIIGGITINELDQLISHQFEHGILSGEYKIGKTPHKRAYASSDFNKLRKALKSEDFEGFKTWSQNERDKVINIRDLFEFKKDPISIDEVESINEILKRFMGGAMSFGSLSPNAHETIARVFNDLGGRSNSGEGGELEERFHDNRRSAIKQVASGRFGVTANYLNNCDEVQIKMAQGAKPGEGGHLPGKKVNDLIAKTRNTLPGTSLISPPPHHDIYSIEDLAQLIYDIKSVTDGIDVSVKLVSMSNVDIVASGVVKTGADKIVISGYNGGTGASPLSSLKNAGLPFEIGLKKTHDLLVKNKLRDYVKLQTDGQIRTAYDVISAGLLGADEVAFGVMALAGIGCIACHKCHTNTCPTGLTTQDPKYQKLYRGSYDVLKRYFVYLATHTREIMAELGFRTFDELIGKASRIKVTKKISKTNALTVDKLLVETPYHVNYSKRPFMNKINEQVKNNIENIKLVNTDRSFGAIIARHMPTLKKFETAGYAGQSYGTFLPTGYTLIHRGYGNDSFAKGLSGGTIVVVSPVGHTLLLGNVGLYGATSGKLFVSGSVGERFGVRNSGAVAVVEGVGKHACEYMTGGIILNLGKMDLNFGAGMSGGVAYVLKKEFETHYLHPDVCSESLDSEDFIKVQELIEEHTAISDSKYSKAYLKTEKEAFIKIRPR